SSISPDSSGDLPPKRCSHQLVTAKTALTPCFVCQTGLAFGAGMRAQREGDKHGREGGGLLTSNAFFSDSSSSMFACTTSMPLSASFFADSLCGFLVTARTLHPGVLLMTFTTPPPWEPVAPVTAMILVMMQSVSYSFLLIIRVCSEVGNRGRVAAEDVLCRDATAQESREGSGSTAGIGSSGGDCLIQG